MSHGVSEPQMRPGTTMDTWSIVYNGWTQGEERLRETLCTLGNGYFATRGAAEESSADAVHYPGTYLAGGYNRAKSEILGRELEHEVLVNWPNWLCLTFRPEGGAWFDLASVEVLDHRQTLRMQEGHLERAVRFRDPQGRVFLLVSRRLVHMENPHLAAIQWELVAENWSGEVTIRTALDGSVTNSGVARYGALTSRQLEVLAAEPLDEESLGLLVQTRQSQVRMAQGARTRVWSAGQRVSPGPVDQGHPGMIAQEFRVPCQAGAMVRVEKVVAIHTSRDFAISEPALEARKAIRRAGSFSELLQSHIPAWGRLWDRCDMQLGESRRTQSILRLHVFHLLQTVSINTIGLDVGVPARGWHGESYRGHIFWDELFIFPYLNLRLPELARSLLMYRYRRLDEARWAARQAGYEGAMYPWQSGSDGREETDEIHINPRSGRWVPDKTHRQRHINAAIAYNVWQYFQATGDRQFLSFYGAEMMLEIARFWASIATYNPQRGRYEIARVVGPDEFHTQYPDADEPGLKNNAYTNVMASWCLVHARQALELLAEDRRRELLAALQIPRKSLDEWEAISRKLYVPFLDNGLISQFEGFGELAEVDWDAYRRRYGNIYRMDRILEAEGDDVNRYKMTKQADVLMLFYLFSAEQLEQIFDRLGYAFDPKTIPDHIDYYMRRSSHGSTLSRLVHGWVLARSDRRSSWQLFEEALESDVSDIQGGTTEEGIHLGAMAGTVDMVQRCYTGIEMRDEVLWLNPRLPEALTDLHMNLCYRGHGLALDFHGKTVAVRFVNGCCEPVRIGFQGEVHTMQPGESEEFTIEESPVAPNL